MLQLRVVLVLRVLLSSVVHVFLLVVVLLLLLSVGVLLLAVLFLVMMLQRVVGYVGGVRVCCVGSCGVIYVDG